jgi:hypothetical protein
LKTKKGGKLKKGAEIIGIRKIFVSSWHTPVMKYPGRDKE